MRTRVSLLLAACALLLFSTSARASDVGLAGAHLAYAIGGAAGPESGFRQGLDAGVMYGVQDRVGNRDGMWDSGSAILFGASVETGFSKYPTYVAGEFGWGSDTTLAGLGAVVGPALRVDHETSGGLAARIAGDLIFVQLGLHVIGMIDGDMQVVATLGFGRF